MKELYSFEISRDVVKEVPYTKKTKDGPVEATKKQKKKVKNNIIIEKPSVSDIEKAEFFFGQKYNEYINAGFLTKSMLYKKTGGSNYDDLDESVKEAILENLEAAKVIDFYDGSEKLSEEQKKKLKNAKEKFVETRVVVQDYENRIQNQFSQTAEVKAEEKMIEWFMFNFSFYEDEVDGNKEIFPIFSGNTFDDKRISYLELCEDKSEISSESLLEVKDIFDASFVKIARAINIWYNKMGSNKKDIDKSIKEIFPDED